MCDPPSLEFRSMVWLLEVYVLVNFEDDIDQMTLTVDVLGNSILKQCAKQGLRWSQFPTRKEDISLVVPL